MRRYLYAATAAALAALVLVNVNTAPTSAQGYPQSITTTLQNGATSSTNGNAANVVGMSAAILTVNCATCSGGTTVNFEGSQDGTNFTALSAVQLGTSTIGTSTTTAGVTVWELAIAGLQQLRARTSGYSAGTVTVTMTAVPVSFDPKSINVAQMGGTTVTAAAAGADGTTGPTAPYANSLNFGFNGSTWDRIRTASSTSTDPTYGALLVANAGGGFTLQASTTKGTNFSGTPKTSLGVFNTLICTWNITSAERDSANETYDLYITSGDGVSSWDVVHFPQVLTTGAKTFTAFVYALSGNYPQEVTTATPGVAAVASGTFKTDTAGSNEGIKTLAAGKVRHGVLGDRINHELVVAGTIATGIVYSINCIAK